MHKNITLLCENWKYATWTYLILCLALALPTSLICRIFVAYNIIWLYFGLNKHLNDHIYTIYVGIVFTRYPKKYSYSRLFISGWPHIRCASTNRDIRIWICIRQNLYPNPYPEKNMGLPISVCIRSGFIPRYRSHYFFVPVLLK